MQYVQQQPQMQYVQQGSAPPQQVPTPVSPASIYKRPVTPASICTAYASQYIVDLLIVNMLSMPSKNLDGWQQPQMQYVQQGSAPPQQVPTR